MSEDAVNISSDNVAKLANEFDATLITAVVVTVLISVSCCVLNSGVLFITWKKRLADKDYRMTYYMNLAAADLVTGVSIGLNTATLALPKVQVFKNMVLCTIIQGSNASGVAISNLSVLLILFAQYLSIRCPFNDSRLTTKTFAVISCCAVWAVGLAICLLPIVCRKDINMSLQTCSISDVYGAQMWAFYTAATFLWIFMMIAITGIGSRLLYEIKTSSSKIHSLRETKKPSMRNMEVKMKTNESLDRERADLFVVSSLHPNLIGRQSGSTSFKPDLATVRTETEWTESVPGPSNNRGRVSFTVAEAEEHRDSRTVKIRRKSTYSRRRDQFMKSARTVGMFVAAYVVFNFPYSIVMAISVVCSHCMEGVLNNRSVRIFLATFFYANGVVNPMLYTWRFESFRRALKQTISNI